MKKPVKHRAAYLISLLIGWKGLYGETTISRKIATNLERYNSEVDLDEFIAKY